jgi:uncharacterized protein (DUF934 family)
MPLLKNGEWILDHWRFFADDQPVPSTRPKIVTLARLKGDDGEFLFHCDCQLGVRVEPHEPVETLEPWLRRLQLVALVFPKFADGRAFSAAAILRQHYGFTGEIRAVGEVLVDQYPLMRRVGFDAFEVAPGRALESWQRARIELSLAYQYDDRDGAAALPVWRARAQARSAMLAAE